MAAALVYVGMGDLRARRDHGGGDLMVALDIMPPDAIHDLALRGDGLEVSAVAFDPVSNSCEVCDPHKATMWSVYIHRDGAGVQCIADWRTEDAAWAHAEQLRATYPTLAQRLILDGSL